MLSLSKTPVREVTVWIMESSFVQVTVVPIATSIVAGEYVKSFIFTDADVADVVVPAGCVTVVLDGAEELQEPAPSRPDRARTPASKRIADFFIFLL